MNRQRILIFALLFSLSFFLFFFKYQQLVVFDADQEYYAQQYQKIVIEHQLTLIGIPTSIGGLHVGPFLNYISAGIYTLFGGNPIGVHLFLLCLLSFQGPLTFLLFSRIKNSKVGFLAGLFAIFSAVMWQSAYYASPIPFLYPMGLLFFYGLLNRNSSRSWCLAMALLLGLSLHIHYSLLLFFPIFGLYLIMTGKIKQISYTTYAYMLISISLFLLPLALFDVRHEYLLIRNFVQFIFASKSVSPGIFESILRVGNSFSFVFSSLFVPALPQIVSVLMAFGFIGYLILNKKNQSIKVALICVSVVLFLLTFYHGPLPDYYFFLLAPVFFYVTADFLVKISRLPVIKIGISLFLALFLMQNMKIMARTINPYNLLIKQKAVSYIKEQVGDTPVVVSVDTDLGLQYGFEYLFDYYQLRRTLGATNVYEVRLRQNDDKIGVDFREENSSVGIKIVKIR